MLETCHLIVWKIASEHIGMHWNTQWTANCLCGSTLALALSLFLSLSLSLSFQISKHSLPKASFPSRTQDQKVLRSFQRSIFMPRSLQEGSTFMISQGEQAQFLSSARVSWGIWCHVASFQWISPQFCSCSFALNCPTLKNGWKTQCSLYHFIVLGGTKPRFFFQFRCKKVSWQIRRRSSAQVRGTRLPFSQISL